MLLRYLKQQRSLIACACISCLLGGYWFAKTIPFAMASHSEDCWVERECADRAQNCKVCSSDPGGFACGTKWEVTDNTYWDQAEYEEAGWETQVNQGTEVLCFRWGFCPATVYQCQGDGHLCAPPIVWAVTSNTMNTIYGGDEVCWGLE